eukprot:644982-Heterocapsa_arctica.AAC.1
MMPARLTYTANPISRPLSNPVGDSRISMGPAVRGVSTPSDRAVHGGTAAGPSAVPAAIPVVPIDWGPMGTAPL